MLKELDVKQALQLLAEEYPDYVSGQFMWGNNDSHKGSLNPCILVGVNDGYFVVKDTYDRIRFCEYFAIEVPDEERYMTQIVKHKE